MAVEELKQNLPKKQNPEQEILKGPGKTRRKFWLGNHHEKKSLESTRIFKAAEKSEKGQSHLL